MPGCDIWITFASMKLVDTHTHLYLEQFDDDRDAVVRLALDAGVNRMLLPNIDPASVNPMMSLHRSFPSSCLPMMGLHPTSVKDDFPEILNQVEAELHTGQYIAVGEIGMDLYWDTTFRDQQEDALRRQLRMAKTCKLPVSLHTRDAFDEIFRIVRDELSDDLKGVFHCFTGSREEALKLIGTGFKLGIGGVVTFKNSGLGEVIRDLPMESLVLETDAPFLAPVPYRGKRNQSSYLVHIAEQVAAIRNMTLDEVADVTSRNASDLFNLNI